MKPLPDHLIEVTIELRPNIERQRVRGFLSQLSEKDETISFMVDGPSGNIILKGMSEPHLLLTIDHIKQGLKVDVDVGSPLIVYRSEPIGEGGTSKLLEPIMQVKVTAPAQYLENILSDLGSRRGRNVDYEMCGDSKIIHALVPLSNLFGYAGTVKSISRNEGAFTLQMSHYDPVPTRLLSNLGISFTPESVVSMRRFAAGLPPHEHNVLLWGIQCGPQGHIQIALGAGHAPKHPSPSALEDRVDGILFYWCSKQADIDLLRRTYCIDSEYGKGPHAIPLPKEGNR